ncbi:polyphosphate kinase [Sulfitobacter sp. SK012]|nr:VOC family protein [Sulfitobacter sp. SK012]AXI48950.1 polyphosphate kinase [Sulfitobacter sp. SK012]
MLTLDHIAVSASDLPSATRHVEASLGVPLQPGGVHAVFHTHNTLLGLSDDLYLEAIAVNPDAPKPDRARWFDLDRFSGLPRLTNWICRCDDLEAALALLPAGFGKPVDLARGDIRWRMAVPQNGVLPFDNCAPALIEWQSDAHPTGRLQQQGCSITNLEVSHPESGELEALLAPFLKDARIGFVAGPAALAAQMQTPGGAVWLR